MSKLTYNTELGYVALATIDQVNDKLLNHYHMPLETVADMTDYDRVQELGKLEEGVYYDTGTD